MADLQNPNENIFQKVLDSISNNKRRVSRTNIHGQPPSLATPSQGMFGSLEDYQQQYLDWQYNKVAYNLYTRTVYFDTDRINSYHDYRAMDHSPEINAALTIMKDECLTRSERGNILEIYSSNDRVKNALHDLLHNRLNIEYNLNLWIRELLKYGDYFVLLHTSKDDGIYDCSALPVEEIHREEGFDGIASVRFRLETEQDYFESWQIAHFRLLEDTSRLPYGKSVLHSARKLWKQLQLAEDAMLIYRITRAPERRIFYVEVGNLEDADVKTYMQRIQKQLKKQPVVNQNNGNVGFRYDPMNISEDYFIPIRGEKSSKIDTLPGACLALDTEIPLLDGRVLELKEIIEEFKNKKELWAYSINPTTGEMLPGKITWAGVTRKDTKVLKITFDNGQSVTVTPDHKFPTRRKGIVEAKDLSVGDSMWSFNKSYGKVWDHKKEDWIPVQEIIKDYSINQKAIQKNKENKEENLINKEELYNHKIISIEVLEEKQDTGTITIDGNHEIHDFHNFALSCGVFTQNSNLSEIQDVEYLQNKLFAALQVPKTYLNYAENLPGGPTLSQADLRFARTINRFQEQVLMELRKIANIHLAFLGLDGEVNNFDLKLTNPSSQQELLKLETMKARLEVFKEFVSSDPYSPASYTWGMKYILGFSDKDIKKMLRQKKIERKLFTEIEIAPQTYKKIGLFQDLDAKFEIPGAAEAMQSSENEDIFGDAGGVGFGGGGASGGLAGDPSGELNLGGDAEPDLGAGSPEPDFGGGSPDDLEPISESKRRKIWNNHNERVDDVIGELLKELEGQEDIASEKIQIDEDEKEKENKLFEANQKKITEIDYTLNSIKSLLGDNDFQIKEKVIKRGVIDEFVSSDEIIMKHNSLVEKANRLLQEINNDIEDSDSELDVDVDTIE